MHGGTYLTQKIKSVPPLKVDRNELRKFDPTGTNNKHLLLQKLFKIQASISDCALSSKHFRSNFQVDAIQEEEIILA